MDTEKRTLRIFAPIDYGRSHFGNADRQYFVESLEADGWKQLSFSRALEMDISFTKLHKWRHRPLAEFAGAPRIPGLCGQDLLADKASLQSTHILACNTGIVLVNCLYELAHDADGDRVRQIYETLSGPDGHFRHVYASIAGYICDYMQRIPLVDEVSRQFSRDVRDEQMNSPHWTHGILTRSETRGIPEAGEVELRLFTAAENIHRYQSDDKKTTRASFGWERTAIWTTETVEPDDTTHNLPDKGLIQLVWIIGGLWEGLYVLEQITDQKVTQLNLKHRNYDVRQKLDNLREYRRAVERISASANPTNITMTERHLFVLSRIAEQWHVPEREKALRDWVAVLELVYTQLRDEDLEQRGRRFNLMIFVVTIAATSGGVASTLAYVSPDIAGGWTARAAIVGTIVAVFLIAALVVRFSGRAWDWIKGRFVGAKHARH